MKHILVKYLLKCKCKDRNDIFLLLKVSFYNVEHKLVLRLVTHYKLFLTI